jgi:hypothetical protein
MSSAKFLIAVAVIIFAISFMRSATRTDRTGDAEVVAQLRKAGSDLSKPHPIEFFLYFPSKAAADRVSDKLNSMGFHAAVEPPVQGKLPWLTYATKNMVPATAELERLRSVFDALSASEQGEYDGWGTPIVQ